MVLPSKPPFMRRRKGLLLWIAALTTLTALVCVMYASIFTVTDKTGNATFIGANYCTPNSYRISIHEYRNGDGYVNLESPDLKILAKADFKAGVEVGRPIWAKDCKTVSISTGGDRFDLKAR